MLFASSQATVAGALLRLPEKAFVLADGEITASGVCRTSTVGSQPSTASFIQTESGSRGPGFMVVGGNPEQLGFVGLFSMSPAGDYDVTGGIFCIGRTDPHIVVGGTIVSNCQRLSTTGTVTVTLLGAGSPGQPDVWLTFEGSGLCVAQSLRPQCAVLPTMANPCITPLVDGVEKIDADTKNQVEAHMLW